MILREDISRALRKLEHANRCIQCNGDCSKQKICRKYFCNFFCTFCSHNLKTYRMHCIFQRQYPVKIKWSPAHNPVNEIWNDLILSFISMFFSSAVNPCRGQGNPYLHSGWVSSQSQQVQVIQFQITRLRAGQPVPSFRLSILSIATNSSNTVSNHTANAHPSPQTSNCLWPRDFKIKLARTSRVILNDFYIVYLTSTSRKQLLI